MAWIINALWTTPTFAGPARNAPDGGNNVKKLLETAPPTCGLLSPEIVQETRASLKKITPNPPFVSPKPPLLADFDQVFALGVESYFEQFKQRRNKISLSKPTTTVESIVVDPIVVDSITVDPSETVTAEPVTSRFSFLGLF